jgi:hypothetical protein
MLVDLDPDTALTAAKELDGVSEVTADALRVHAALAEQSARERAVIDGFTTEFQHVAVLEVAAQATDVHDLDGLRAIFG